ncbi:MAG: hypothetical protein AAFQ82_21645, partial [Myxococcota bacterium]
MSDSKGFEVADTEVQRYLEGKVELGELLGMGAERLEQLKGRAQFYLDGGHHERALIMLEMIEELDRTDHTAKLLAVEVLLALG